MLIGCSWRQPPASIRALPTKPLPPQGVSESAPHSAAQLDELVARVALYPDELLALVLPASTQPIQIVEAARFLDARQSDPMLTPMEAWDASVRSLLNYPDVIRLMNQDLDWTQALGGAVTSRQADVMEAIQQVRTRALAAGNLKTNAQQKVTQEAGIIRIESADPEVIFVPIYDPTVIYVASPVQIVTYYPPYPCYWCPSAVYGTGMWMGFDWYYHDIYYDHHHHHDDHYDHDRPARPERPDNVWKPSRPPGGERPLGRPSTLPAQPGAGANRPGPAGPEGPVSMDRLTKLPSAANLPASAARPTTLPGERPGYQKPSAQDGGYERGRDAIRDGNRGAQSRGLDSGGRGGYGNRSVGGGSSWGGYGAGNSANAWSSRGAASRGGMYGGGGGGFGGGGRGGGGGGGRGR